MISRRVQEVAQRHLGRETTVRELRLLPYVLHTLLNSGRFDPRRISDEEREIMDMWRKEHRLEVWRTDAIVPKKGFYNAIVELLWAGYAQPIMKGLRGKFDDDR